MAIYGGFWTGSAVVGLGEPGALPSTAQAIQAAMHPAGLAFGWRALRMTDPMPDAIRKAEEGQRRTT